MVVIVDADAALLAAALVEAALAPITYDEPWRLVESAAQGSAAAAAEAAPRPPPALGGVVRQDALAAHGTARPAHINTSTACYQGKPISATNS
jgi:hypothetical protein